jgi:hypothetical protein
MAREPASPRAQVALADDGAGEAHEGLMDVGAAFPTDTQAEEVKPGEGALER